MIKSENIIQQKTFSPAVKVIRLVKSLEKEQKEYVPSIQLMRPGTAIGALVREVEHAENKKDFIHKTSISLKEANETRYWLDLLEESKPISTEQLIELQKENTEVIKILASIVKSSKIIHEQSFMLHFQFSIINC